MQCPHCHTSRLLLSERSGVEIDYCPSCRGVWLDRYELDKLIALAGAAAAPSVDAQLDHRPPPPAPRDNDDDDDGFVGGRRREERRKKNWLSEFFD